MLDKPLAKRNTIRIALTLTLAVALGASRADSQTLKTLVAFTGMATGENPSSGVIAVGNTLYGVTLIYGPNGGGTIFSVGMNGANFQNIFSFNGNNSGYPNPDGKLTISGTTLYGTTDTGGTQGLGSIFSVGTDGSNYQNLLSVTGSGGSYAGGNLIVSGTTLYGTTQQGGVNGDGNIFSMGMDGTNYQNLVSFTGTGGTAIGAQPYRGLILGGSEFYGITGAGGVNNVGSVFSVVTGGTGFKSLVSFTGSGGKASGSSPFGNLVLSGTTLYGTTLLGGTNGDGNVFSVGIDGSNFRDLLSFTGTRGAAIGLDPSCLTLTGTTLYGVTGGGGIFGKGNVYSIGIDGSSYTDLYSFTGGTDSRSPVGALALSGGTLFGVTSGYGGTGFGSVFALTLPTPTPEPGTLLLVGAMFAAAFVWRRWRRLAIIAAIAVLPSSVVHADVFNMPSGQTSLQFVTVGDPGNVADPTTTRGAVSCKYTMGTYDVTVAQYTQFLNAVAATDNYGVYSLSMGTAFTTFGIARFGSSGSYTYSVTGSAALGKDNMPVSSISWGDAARFCNWLDNGQGTASTSAQAYALTETGAYNLNGARSNTELGSVALPLHSGSGAARYFIPSENEWYKAAYYKSGGTNAGYWYYPTQSDSSHPPDDSLLGDE